MALNVSVDSQTLIFKTLFGETHPVTLAVIGLINEGAVFGNSMFVVNCNYKGNVYTQTLTVGVNSLMKGSANEQAKQQCMFLLTNFVDNITCVQLGGAKAAPAQAPIQPATPFIAPEINKVLSGAPKSNASIVSGGEVIALKAATNLGQKVKGTSQGKVYRVIALSDKIKVASAIMGNSASLRVEWAAPLTGGELESLKQVFSVKPGYGSVHVADSEVPIHRVIGAMLFSLGIEFDVMVHGKKELEKANA